jgi:hypothetical protein
MNALWIALGVLGLAALSGTGRALRVPQRKRWARLPASLILAVGLALILFPPSWPRDRTGLLVLTAGADVPAARQRHPDLPVVALPGVDAGAEIERVSDLATALRRHPLAGRLQVVGDGLPARDREAIGELNLAFDAGPALVGIVDLQIPEAIHAGRGWSLRGRVAGVSAAQVELRDRSDRVVSTMPIDTQGQFTLQAIARVEGQAEYQLRVTAGDGALVEEMPLTFNVLAGDRLDILILSGGPDAELKYLRRWLLDSGNRVSSRIVLSRGIEQRQDGAETRPARLAESDVLIVDERSWAALAASEKAAITDAIGQGLGVLLRVTGPLPDTVVADWKQLGFTLETTDLPRSVRLAGAPTAGEAIGLTRWPVRIAAARSSALHTSSEGLDLGRWIAVERGRAGVWLLGDAYRLVLRGESSRFESLWADVLATLARARGIPSPSLPAWPRVGQRSVICDLAGDAHVEAADGDAQPLWVEPDARGCASWWPAQAGSHNIVDAAGRWPLHVAEAAPLRTLWRAQTREETQALVRSDVSLPKRQTALPRWLIFLIWLPLAGMFWWLERRR